jgi:predicted metal-dependent hydrolase
MSEKLADILKQLQNKWDELERVLAEFIRSEVTRGRQQEIEGHWRVMLLPPARIEYLVLHELCHLHHHDHSPAFYERLRRASPNYHKHDAWLRAHGDGYRL